MATDGITYNELDLMKKGIDLRCSSRSGVLVSASKETTKCPLELVCFPSCYWWKEGRCVFPMENNSRATDAVRSSRRLAGLQRKVASLGKSRVGVKKNRTFLEYFVNTLLTATSCALLWFFGCIWIEGSHYIQEPNTMILSVETAVIAAILGFALHNIIRMVRRRSK